MVVDGKDDALVFRVSPSSTIKSIKYLIQPIERLSAHLQLLEFAGKEMKDDFTLADLNILRNAIFHLSIKTMTIFIKVIGGLLVHFITRR